MNFSYNAHLRVFQLIISFIDNYCFSFLFHLTVKRQNNNILRIIYCNEFINTKIIEAIGPAESEKKMKM